MALEPLSLLAVEWGAFFWNFGALALFFMGLFLVLIILVQDSGGGGIGGAFGGGGGESILGARGQRGITRFTAVLGGTFAVLMLVLGACDPQQRSKLPGDPPAGSTTIGAGAEKLGDEEPAGDEAGDKKIEDILDGDKSDQ